MSEEKKISPEDKRMIAKVILTGITGSLEKVKFLVGKECKEKISPEVEKIEKAIDKLLGNIEG